MKIGVDARAARWYRGTGIGTYTYQIIYNLNRIDNYNEYLLFWPGEDHDEIEISHNFNFNVVGEKHDKFWEEIHIPNRLLDEKVDLYHVPQNGIGLPTRKDCLFVTTIHDLIPYVLPETVGKGYLKIFLEQMPYIIENSDLIITVSNYSKKDIIGYFEVPSDKIVVTHLAAEDIYQPMERGKARKIVEDRYGIKDDFILYLGGFSPRKNIRELILAFENVYRNLKQTTKLVIVGKPGREYEELEKLVNEHNLQNEVIFAGFIPLQDLPIFYNAAKVFVYPSLYEGFGLPPLEAMACGTPVITSNVTSIPEVVGEAAILINPYDRLDLAGALFDVLENEELAFSLSLKGLERASNFSWQKTAIETLHAYQKTVAEHRKI